VKPLRYARKIAFLGEMKELGAESDAAHAALATDIIEAKFDALFLLGISMKSLEVTLKKQHYLAFYLLFFLDVKINLSIITIRPSF
jgi:UDP-N-acetylmuramyl pentapeptide synthase